MTIHISKKVLLVVSAALSLFVAGFLFSLTHSPRVVHAASPAQSANAASAMMDEGVVPKNYGHLVTAIADRIGTGLVFEGDDGTIRFVSITGMKEGQLFRYDKTPMQGGIPKSYGRLVTAVINGKGTGLIFEDEAGVIRFVTLTGEIEGQLKRE